MSVRPARAGDLDVWAEMRAALWPEASAEEHRRELTEMLAATDAAAFVVTSGGEIVGFVEASLRPYADGCRTSPVGYVEGWYIRPGSRRRGLGRELVRAAEDWARGKGCREMASDTEAANRNSQAAHRRLGYDTVGTVVVFRKSL